MIDKINSNNSNSPEIRKLKRIAGIAGRVLFILLIVVTVILYGGMRYLLDNWSDLSMDELIFHLKSTLEGTNPDMVRDGLLRYGLPAILVIAVIITILLLLRNKKRLRSIYVACVLAVAVMTLILMKLELDRKVGFSDYFAAQFLSDSSDFIAERYIDPNSVELQFPDQKRNLVYIYLESAEVTFADQANGGAFEQNIIPELTALAQENEDFSGEDPALNGGISLLGSTWTIGAMFAQSTGLPLKVPINGNMVSAENFFLDIPAIGTILEQEGYRQELLIGSRATFGGRSDFYLSHGNYEIRDYNYAVEKGLIPEDYFEFWGFEDEKLFEYARNDLLELSASGQPFNLTILTVDTHFEDGYKCRLCRDEFGEQYADVFACSSRQVSEFINWIRKQSFYENTTIILCGDHPTMDKDFCGDVPGEYMRKTYVSVINAVYDDSSYDRTKRREYDTFDMFPTTLAALNVVIPGNRLGLGVNLFSEEPTLVEELGFDTCQQKLAGPSAFMNSMCSIEINEEMLEKARKDTSFFIKKTHNGNTLFGLSGLSNNFSYSAIDGVELELTDKESGDSTLYDCELEIRDTNSVSKYFWKKEVSLGDKTPDDYDVAFYITIGDFKHYKITQ